MGASVEGLAEKNRERYALAELAPGTARAINRLLNVLTYCVLFLGLATIAVTGMLVVHSYSGMPTADQWAPIEWLAAHNGIAGWQYLWQQHNEHRLLIPNIFYLVDIYLFHAQSIFLLVSIFFLQSLHLLLWVVVLAKRFTPPIGRAAIGFAAFCLFRPTQIQNFIWGFQICFILTLVAGVAAFAAITLGARSAGNRRGYFLAAIVCAVIASFSSLNGLLVWPVLVIACLALQWPRRVVALLIGTAAACLAAYFWGYAWASSLKLGQAAEIAKYFSYYFGASVHYLGPGSWNSVSALVVLGTAALAVTALLVAYIRVIRDQQIEPFRLFLVSTGLFCIATAAMTALGRAQMGPEQAAAGRYQSYAMLFWLCFILTIVDTMQSREQQSKLIFGALLAVIAAWMLAGMTQVPAFARALKSQRLEEETATLAIAAHAWDPILADFSPQSFLKEKNAQDMDFLWNIRGWIYDDKFYRALGQPLSATYALAAPTACQGELQQANGGANNLFPWQRLYGWGWDVAAKVRVEQVLIVDPEGDVIGLGRGSDHEFPGNQRSSDPRSWFAFVSPSEHPASLRAYAVVGAPAKACLLAAGALENSAK